ncbi:MAG: YqgE/AlgH family protein [Flavobacteriales bacterium]|nr:MAG: YqgE/AlgH family protein [Flavobacteriales bacterium]|tara:strand:- start:3133 stop:3669 length:537 start_codon:yes stop_codon:yes gene_type:complete
MKGKILLATPKLLTDFVFCKSIILIVDETEDGLTGFILNRITSLHIAKEGTSNNSKIDLYFGGPVSNNHFYILRSEKKHSHSIKINKNTYWGNNVELIIQEIEDGRFNKDDVSFFQGYSGWDINQLNNEIDKNYWIILDSENEEVLNLNKKNSWQKLLKKLDNSYLIWSNSPDDITLN